MKLCLNLDDSTLKAVKFVDKTSEKHRLQLLRKIRNPSQDNEAILEENTKMEISTMTKLRKHPNVVKLHEVIDDPLNSKTLLVMEYITGGPLMSIDKNG